MKVTDVHYIFEVEDVFPYRDGRWAIKVVPGSVRTFYYDNTLGWTDFKESLRTHFVYGAWREAESFPLVLAAYEKINGV